MIQEDEITQEEFINEMAKDLQDGEKPKSLLELKKERESKPKKKGTHRDTSKAVKASNSPESRRKAEITKQTTLGKNQFVREVVYNSLKEVYFTQGKDGRENYKRLIESIMNEAIKNPNSRAAAMIGNGFFTPDVLSKIDEASEKYRTSDVSFLRYRLQENLFKEQKEVLNDGSIYRRKTMFCGRRAGKSFTCARILVYYMIEPNSHVYYIGLTFQKALEQIWDNVMIAINTLGLPIKESHKNEGTITLTNGSILHIAGNATIPDEEKLRGGRARCIICDEAAAQRNLKAFLGEILEPMTADYADSVIILAGTGPKIPHTYWEECILSNKWHHYHWTCRDNPNIPNADEFIANFAESRGITIDSPLVKREMEGVLAYDTEAMVYKDPTIFTEIPKDFIPNRCYIGVDYGATDANGVVALIADSYTKKGYVITDKKFRDSSVSVICKEIMDARNEALKFILERNPKFELNKCFVVCDTNEKSISYELSRTYKVPNVCNAYKHDKQMATQQLSEWCRTGVISIKKDSYCYDEMKQTIYKRDESTDAILPEIDDSIFHPDVLDAFLYASRLFCYDCFDVETKPKAVKALDNTINPNFSPFKEDESDDIIWD